MSYNLKSSIKDNIKNDMRDYLREEIGKEVGFAPNDTEIWEYLEAYSKKCDKKKNKFNPARYYLNQMAPYFNNSQYGGRMTHLINDHKCHRKFIKNLIISLTSCSVAFIFMNGFCGSSIIISGITSVLVGCATAQLVSKDATW